MPNGRRRRFSVKQDIATKSPKDAQNSSDSKIRSNEQKTKNIPQNSKPNKLKNKLLATSSIEPPEILSPVIESDSSHHIVPNRTLSVDKDVMVTSSNIDFFNILNLSSVRLPNTEGQTVEKPKVNQKETTEKKETKIPRRDNYPRHHRMKVRSPRRRGEVNMENNKITTGMGAIDWDKEHGKTCTDISTEKQLTNAEHKYNSEQQSKQSSAQDLGNPTDHDNLNNESISTSQDGSSNHNTINESNSIKQKQLINQITPNNQIIDPGNRTVQSFPVYVYGMNPVNPNHPIVNQASSLMNSNNNLNIINQEIQPSPGSLNNYASPINHPSNNSLDVMCRICHGGESLSIESGQMISACGCRGTVGRVHVKCLERWLTESGKSRCELCGTRYSTERVHKYGFPKALAIWVLSQNAKQLMVDSLGIMLMSPLAVVAAWLSGRTLAGLMTPESQQTPWPLASTFVLACMTLVCYYCWIVSAVTRHALGWWIWYRSQYEVRLQLQENED